MLRTIRDLNVKDKRIFLRVDFNVPIHEGVVQDDFKVISALPTIRHLYSNGAKSIVIGSHLGRPKGMYQEEFTLKPVYEVMKRFFREELCSDLSFCSVENIEEASHPWILLENLRFNTAEEVANTPHDTEEYRSFFVKNADVAVIDAFGCLHRECGSIQRTGLPSYAGLLVEKELSLARRLLESDLDLVILGGKKISDKIKLLFSLMKKTKKLFIVGGLAFPFLKYKLGMDTGASIVGGSEEEVKKICDAEREFGTNVILPVDFIILRDDQVFAAESIPSDSNALDIGPKTVRMLESEISSASNVFWNGPPGMFENNYFSRGTEMLVRSLKNLKSQGKSCFCGGGETASAVRAFGSYDDFTHVSTGGGALMKLLSGEAVPGLEFLQS